MVFKKSLCRCALDESSHSIGRVKLRVSSRRVCVVCVCNTFTPGGWINYTVSATWYIAASMIYPCYLKILEIVFGRLEITLRNISRNNVL